MSFWDEVSCLIATLLTPATPITLLPDLCTVHTNPLTPLDLHNSPAFVLGRLLTYCTKNSSGEETPTSHEPQDHAWRSVASFDPPHD